MKTKLNMRATEQAQRQEYKKEMDTLCEETKRRFLLLKEEDGKLKEKITSKELWQSNTRSSTDSKKQNERS